MKRKFDLDAAVASELGLSIAEVKDITTAFLERLREHLSSQEVVHLDGFGRFRVVISPGSEKPHELTMVGQSGKKKTKQLYTTHRKVRVHFSKAEPFNRLLRAKLGPASEKKS
jgi:hypothetical protein